MMVRLMAGVWCRLPRTDTTTNLMADRVSTNTMDKKERDHARVAYAVLILCKEFLAG